MADGGSFDTDAVRRFQVHGQDIPWLLAHWAGAA